MNELLTHRLERYFAHPNDDRAVLRRGMKAVACLNVRRAMGMLYLMRGGGDSELFDDDLHAAVSAFQEKYRHRVVDGIVGPGTRKLLVNTLFAAVGPGVFSHFSRTERAALVFISYAWKDQEKVDKLDQWLRDHGVDVVRDQTDFAAGEGISDSIRLAIGSSDKVLAIHSANSSGREWPTFETFIASELEDVLKERLLIYVRLDDTPLPERVTGRLHIDARTDPLRRVGERLIQAINGGKLPTPRHDYDEDKPL